jgi:hypothetical protein
MYTGVVNVCILTLSLCNPLQMALVWSQYLESFTLNKRILPYLQEEHHRQRVLYKDILLPYLTTYYKYDEMGT